MKKVRSNTVKLKKLQYIISLKENNKLARVSKAPRYPQTISSENEFKSI